MKLHANNRVTLLRNGAAFFPALLEAIESAKELIHVETYIYVEDTIGKTVTAALIRAAQRGVTVRLLLDGFGARNITSERAQQLHASGLQLRFYRPDISPWTLRRHRLRRLHRKIVLIDDRLAFVGGINIIDDLSGSLSPHPRFDYAVAVQGPAVLDVTEAAQRLWRRYGGGNAWPLANANIPTQANAGNMQAAFLQRDNFRHRRKIEAWYRYVIGQARSEIIICNPYFLPGIRLRHALIRAARHGVHITILLQGRADHPLLQQATRALYGQLLGAGITIVEYHKSMLHGKVAVIDREWATVGSSNLDPFSLLLNREANIVVRNQSFAIELKTSLDHAIQDGGVTLNAADWGKRPLLAHVIAWGAYSLARLMIGLFGLRGS